MSTLALYQARFTSELHRYVVPYSVYTFNHLVHDALSTTEFKTPSSPFHGKQIDALKTLKVFGCVTYQLIPHALRRNKFASIAFRGLILVSRLPKQYCFLLLMVIQSQSLCKTVFSSRISSCGEGDRCSFVCDF